jgi:hypothetical protein
VRSPALFQATPLGFDNPSAKCRVRHRSFAAPSAQSVCAVTQYAYTSVVVMIIQPDFLTIRPILGAAPMTVGLGKAAVLSLVANFA